MIRRGNKNHEQEKTLANINMFFSGINNAINFIDSMILQFKMILEARKRAAEEQDETGLKILTPKQLLQRLPESLLNEIRQIVHSLYQSKQITKKVYNNIKKSIQV